MLITLRIDDSNNGHNTLDDSGRSPAIAVNLCRTAFSIWKKSPGTCI